MNETNSEETEVFVGSGNVFADIGLSNPEERQPKAQLSIEIEEAIQRKRLSKKQAAQKLGLSLHDLAELLEGALPQFSINQLVGYLHCLGRDVTLSAFVREAVPKAKKTAQREEPKVAIA